MKINRKDGMKKVCLLVMVLVIAYAYAATAEINRTKEENQILEDKYCDISDRLMNAEDEHKDSVQKLQEEHTTLVTELEEERNELRTQNDDLSQKIEAETKERKRLDSEVKKLESVSRSGSRTQPAASQKASANASTFEITAYDLSVESCGRYIGDPSYGKTASGYSLVGHSWESARVVAADPKVFPMGTKLKLTFPDSGYEKFNGVYTVRDTGGAIKGNKLDFFMGDFQSNTTHNNVWNFGRRSVKVEVVN